MCITNSKAFLLWWFRMKGAEFRPQALILSCLLKYDTFIDGRTQIWAAFKIFSPLQSTQVLHRLLSRPLWLLWAIPNHPNIFWRCIIHVIHSLHRDIANYTLLMWALVDIDLFLCTCCPIACTSGAPRSRVVASLGSLVPEPFHRAWHSSVSHAPHPCLWSHPPNSLLSWNLQCISSGNPGASNDAVAGSSVIKRCCVCEEGTRSCVVWQHMSTNQFGS